MTSATLSEGTSILNFPENIQDKLHTHSDEKN